jgi:predicted small secreted protein
LIDVNSGGKSAFNRGKKPAPYEKSSAVVDKPFLRHSFRASLTKNRLGTTSAHWGAKKPRREEMKKILVLALVGLSIASCTPTQQGAGIGAASGAIIGGAVTGNVRGAAVGAAIGGVSGALIGRVAEQPGQCYYRDQYGRRYIDDCR